MPDEEHPASRCDPVLTWTWPYLDFFGRPVDPNVLQDTVLRALLTRAILDAGYTAGDITDAWLLRVARDYFHTLRAFAHVVIGKLPQAVRDQYQALVFREPPPTDAEVLAFWQAHFPDYDEFYRATVERRRIAATWEIVTDRELRQGRPNWCFTRIGYVPEEDEQPSADEYRWTPEDS
jgi:hypothetical protein